MIALSESTADLTTPLRPPRILSWFDSLSAGRCTLPQLSRHVLEACRADPDAAAGVLLLLEEYGKAGKLKQFDFRPLQRELERRQQVHAPAPETAAPPPSPPPARAARRDPDPTRTLVEPVDTPAPAAKAEINDGTPASAAATAPVGPTTILRGRYVLHDEIGRGGVGTVYLALDRNRAGLPHEQQFVALKVVRDEHARRPETLHALRREFHQAQALSHAGIVNVFDFDHDGDTYFVTMELINGEPLGELIRDALPHPIARETAIRILRELGDAVVFAHERDVLHMDLKPGNVMVTQKGDVRVLDFGVAQTFMAEPWISDLPSPPAATPAYASCERLVGDLPDVRDDIFSFACLAYELLSGKHPFDRGSALEARHAGRKPRRIRGLSHRQWRALKRGLAWSREDRPSTMRELLDGLALPPATVRRSERRPLRAQRRVALSWRPAAALGLIVLGTIAALSWNRLPADVRADFSQRAAATGSTLDQALQTARAWVTAEPVASTVDVVPAAVTSSTSRAAPPPELAASAVEPPLAEPNASDVDITVVDPAPTEPMDAAAEPSETEPAGETGPSVDMGSSIPPAQVGAGPGVLAFTSDTYTVSESDSMARVSVRRRGGAAGQTSFGWRTVDDSALAGEDYASAEGRETMADGETTATLLIPIVGDSVAEHIELLEVVTEDASGAELGSVTRVPLIIVDDD
jgi:serine/threonine protein kinase